MYHVFYLIFSALGHLNFFFFAVHLVDIVTSSKALTTILQSVTHNGKQLCLTVMMLCILVWLYAVVAFNFFRKFYVEAGEEGEEPNYKCHNMFTVSEKIYPHQHNLIVQKDRIYLAYISVLHLPLVQRSSEWRWYW